MHTFFVGSTMQMNEIFILFIYIEDIKIDM